MAKTCFLCATPINGRSVEVYAEPFFGGAATHHPAHPDCARMLEDDEPDADDEGVGDDEGSGDENVRDTRAMALANGHILDRAFDDEDCMTQECVQCEGYLQYDGRVQLATDGLDVRCAGAEREAGVG